MEISHFFKKTKVKLLTFLKLWKMLKIILTLKLVPGLERTFENITFNDQLIMFISFHKM